MNEQIQELLNDATCGLEPDLSPQRTITLNEMEKFAELIVAECRNLAEAEQKRYASITHRNMSECAVALANFSLLLKDHFGVEE